MLLRDIMCVFLLMADWSREVIHNDGKTGSWAARHNTTGMFMLIFFFCPQVK